MTNLLLARVNNLRDLIAAVDDTTELLRDELPAGNAREAMRDAGDRLNMTLISLRRCAASLEAAAVRAEP